MLFVSIVCLFQFPTLNLGTNAAQEFPSYHRLHRIRWDLYPLYFLLVVQWSLHRPSAIFVCFGSSLVVEILSTYRQLISRPWLKSCRLTDAWFFVEFEGNNMIKFSILAFEFACNISANKTSDVGSSPRKNQNQIVWDISLVVDDFYCFSVACSSFRKSKVWLKRIKSNNKTAFHKLL